MDKQIAAARPRAQRAARLAENVVRLLTVAGVDPVRACAVIDVGGTKGCWNWDRLPCLTATRGSTGGFWLTNRGRFTTSLELMRCQGFKPCEMDTSMLSARQLGRALGNAMSVDVVAALLKRLLQSTNFWRP